MGDRGLVVLGSGAIPGRPRLTGASWSWRQPPRDRRADEQPLLGRRHRGRPRVGPRGRARPGDRQRCRAGSRSVPASSPGSPRRAVWAWISTARSTWSCSAVDGASRARALPAAPRRHSTRFAVARSAARSCWSSAGPPPPTAWLERNTASRTRALIEERGLRARTPGQRRRIGARRAARTRRSRCARRSRRRAGRRGDHRQPRPAAHHLGADESAWPVPEDRSPRTCCSERIADPWLRELTSSASALRPCPARRSLARRAGPPRSRSVPPIASDRDRRPICAATHRPTEPIPPRSRPRRAYPRRDPRRPARCPSRGSWSWRYTTPTAGITGRLTRVPDVAATS